jgi:hypothetical protein
MADGVIKRGNPFAYLGATGIRGGGSKSADVAKRHVKVKGHVRGAPTYSGPDNAPNPAMVDPEHPKHIKNPETKPGAATIASRAKSGSKGGATTTANSGKAEEGKKHEASESKSYEKMEEKTLKGVKISGKKKK